MSKLKTNLLTYLGYFSYFVLLNLQFILLSLLGLGIFGIAPAIAAIIPIFHDFRCQRKMVKFSVFFANYKQAFLKSNALSLIFGLIAVTILLNIRISILYLPNFAYLKFIYLLFLAVLTLVYLFMLCNLIKNASLSWKENFRLSCFMLARFPAHSIALVCALVCIYFVVSLKSGLFILLGFSSFLFILEFFHATLIEKIQKLTNKWG